ncbi:transcription factor Opi1-domain-containing protein [Cyathus striatus]|nr:transcription factor Opi1-domain-containing protein [Cyathus striatus]
MTTERIASGSQQHRSTSPNLHLLDDQDEDVRIAVRALGDMRMMKSARSNTSPTTTVSPLASPLLPPLQVHQHQQQQQGLVSRVSNFPLVGSALRAYDYGKNSSRVVKYGAQMVESSLSTISRPLIDRLPVNVERLDEFACQQLDRLDRYRRPSTALPHNEEQRDEWDEREREREGRRIGRGGVKTFDGAPPLGEEDDSTSTSREQSRTSRDRLDGGRDSSSTTPTITELPSTTTSTSPTTTTREDSRERTADGAVVPRSRWQAVLLEAGGLGAALSEESMRRLKYCLQWLQYATAHIDAQILILRDFIASLQPLPSSSSTRPPISEEHLRKLTAVRRDIVHTIRQVVDVVSKYAGGALPEPARGRVRGFILKLPQRWASATRATSSSSASGSGALISERGERGERERERESVVAAASGVTRRRKRDGYRSGTSSRATSPSSSPRMSRLSMTPSIGGSPEHGLVHGTPHGVGSHSHPSGSAGGGGQVTHGSAVLAAQRILTLATESLDMMRGVTGVVKESLDRADAWVGRLRNVGFNPSSSSTAPNSTVETGAPPGGYRDPGEEMDMDQPYRHTRNISNVSEDHPPSLFFPSSASSSTTNSLPSTPFPPFADVEYTYSVPPSPRLGGGFGTPGTPGTLGKGGGGSGTAPGSPIASAIGRMSIAPGGKTSMIGSGVLGENEGGIRRAVKEEEEEGEEGGMDVDL